MKITDHFDSDEFGCHDGTPYPDFLVEPCLKPLCAALEVIRERCGGAPVHVDSGYRTPAYNRQIGGAEHSQHCRGRAADIVVEGLTAEKVHAIVLGLSVDGIIQIGGLGAYPNFTHVDVRESDTLVQWQGSRSSNVA